MYTSPQPKRLACAHHRLSLAIPLYAADAFPPLILSERQQHGSPASWQQTPSIATQFSVTPSPFPLTVVTTTALATRAPSPCCCLVASHRFALMPRFHPNPGSLARLPRMYGIPMAAGPQLPDYLTAPVVQQSILFYICNKLTPGPQSSCLSFLCAGNYSAPACCVRPRSRLLPIGLALEPRSALHRQHRAEPPK